MTGQVADGFDYECTCSVRLASKHATRNSDHSPSFRVSCGDTSYAPCSWHMSPPDPSCRAVSRASGACRTQVRQLEREKEMLILAYDQKVSELHSSVLVTRQDYSALRQEAEEYKRVRMPYGRRGWCGDKLSCRAGANAEGWATGRRPRSTSGWVRLRTRRRAAV